GGREKRLGEGGCSAARSPGSTAWRRSGSGSRKPNSGGSRRTASGMRSTGDRPARKECPQEWGHGSLKGSATNPHRAEQAGGQKGRVGPVELLRGVGVLLGRVR